MIGGIDLETMMMKVFEGKNAVGALTAFFHLFTAGREV